MTTEIVSKLRKRHEMNPNSLKNLVPVKPGQVLNPHGRPKKEISITSKVKELLEHEVDAVAKRVINELKKPHGKYPTGLFCEVLNRIEGRVPGELPPGWNDNRVFNIVVLDSATKELINKIKERTGRIATGNYESAGTNEEV